MSLINKSSEMRPKYGMTLSKHKSICLSIVRKQKRQSFEKQFCDELSEAILQYLPLKDKLRLESVSKQFQRTIFQRQHYLWVTIDNSSEDYFFDDFKFKIKGFESVLKKCPNIKSIVLRLDGIQSEDKLSVYKEQIISLIDKYCNNLIEFNSYLAFNEFSWNKLINKINSNTFTLHLDKTFNDFKSLSFVKKLRIESFPYFVFWSEILEVKNIIKIDFTISEPLIEFQRFIENNKRVKYLSLRYFPDTLFMDESSIVVSMTNISKLKNLVELKFDNFLSLKSESIISSLKEISMKCKQLKSLSFETSYEDIESGQLYQILKSFNNLKRLNLMFEPNSGSLSLFNDLSERLELTNLTIKGIKSSFFLSLKRIDEFLPKLRVLKVFSCDVIPKELPETLGRLLDLEEINISIIDNYDYFEENAELCQHYIIRNCRRIRKIEISENYSDLDDQDEQDELFNLYAKYY